MSERVFFIVNPRSGSGQTGHQWDVSLRTQLKGRFPQARWAFTGAPGHGSRLAQQAWREGADLVVAIGGDGTVNEVVNGLMWHVVGDLESGLPGSQGASWPDPPMLDTTGLPSCPRPILGTLNQGTGGDFVKSIDTSGGFLKALDALESGRTVTADIGQIELTAKDGSAISRYFINIAGCGANGEVVDRVNRASKQLGGFLTFLSATITTTARFYSPQVSIAYDDEPARTTTLNVLFVCNAQYCGGGMRVGKGARFDDGKFRVIQIDASSRLRSLLHGGRLYSGNMGNIPFAHIRDARKIHVSSNVEVLIDCDGEMPGRLPATFTLVEGALRVRVGPNAVVVSK